MISLIRTRGRSWRCCASSRKDVNATMIHTRQRQAASMQKENPGTPHWHPGSFSTEGWLVGARASVAPTTPTLALGRVLVLVLAVAVGVPVAVVAPVVASIDHVAVAVVDATIPLVRAVPVIDPAITVVDPAVPVVDAVAVAYALTDDAAGDHALDVAAVLAAPITI